MSTNATNNATALSLTVDPARWNEDLVRWANEFYHHHILQAQREVAATMSAILGDGRRFILHHNAEGRWSVRIDETTKDVIEVHWSSVTPDAGYLRNIKRGEAVMVLIHETGHLLYTTEINRPTWCDPAHWKTFFTVVNFAEDVRIEDRLEAAVPAFPVLRRIENDRMVMPNVHHWPHHDPVHRVSMTLFAERSCTDGSALLLPLATPEERHIIDASRQAFIDATQASDTQGMLDALQPMYDALLPLMQATPLPPAPAGPQPTPKPTDSGEPTDDDGTGHGGDADGEDTDETGASPGTSDDAEEEGGTSNAGGGGDDDDADEYDEDAGNEGDEDADEYDEDGDEDADEDGEGEGDAPDDTPGDVNDYAGKGSGSGNGANLAEGTSETARPDRERGKWSQDRDTSVPTPDNASKIANGETIVTRRPIRSREWTEDNDPAGRLLPVTRMLAKSLRRTLQDNANGGWINRRRAGAFDPASAKRLAIGDLRTFRKRSGPKGSLDYSLVVCMDASGSVGGAIGQSISDAAVTIYEAARRIDGLDVALCAYGSTVDFGIPFDGLLTDKHAKRRDHISTRMYRNVRGGSGGGTNEVSALAWAVAVSKRRNAEAKMIVVLTDGEPASTEDVKKHIAWARHEGIATGGIGVRCAAPTYHANSTSINDVQQLPQVLGAFVRTMMKGGK